MNREDVTAQIKESADIVQIIGEHVELRKSGARFMGLCPFHGEKTPSFTVHPSNQFFYCFGCGASGDVFSFMMQYHNIDFPEAVKQLAQRYGITLPEKKMSQREHEQQQAKKLMYAVNKKSADLFAGFLKHSPQAEAARRYLQQRQIPAAVSEQFGLGYAPSTDDAGWNFLGSKLQKAEVEVATELGLLSQKEKGGTYDRFRDRILFPIYDISGQVCGFTGRIIGEGQPKYMNSPESPIYDKGRSLLGLYQLKESIRRNDRVILVEGNFDLISLVVHGFDNVVAPLGTSLTRPQLRLLKRFASEAVLLFDGDQAGIKAAKRAVPLFLAEQISGKVALLPIGHDPDTYVNEFGKGALQILIDDAKDLSEFLLQSLVDEFGISLEGKTKIVEELQPVIGAAANPLQRSVIIGHFADKLNIPAMELERLPGPPVDEHIPLDIGLAYESMQRKPHAVAPLTPPQKRLISFMVLYPDKLDTLAEAGLREVLADSLGEVLYLQIKRLYHDRDMVEPEDLLSVLPEGPERKLVSDILLSASVGEGGSDQVEEADCLAYLQRSMLTRESDRVMQEIVAAQHGDDFDKLQRLLMQKQEIDKKIRALVTVNIDC